MLPLLLLGGCGGGGGESLFSPESLFSQIESALPMLAPAKAKAKISEADAARLAKQATFGATTEVIDRIEKLGADGWIDEQFATRGSTYAGLLKPVRRSFCSSISNPEKAGTCYRANYTRDPAAMRFYANAINQPDQLRQRVAFALSQLLVASVERIDSTAGVAALNQILLDNAFGNYRDILFQVTMNSYMGAYLDMANSQKNAPSENYAREMLQLFSLGPKSLKIDGTPELDAAGEAISNYGPDDIKGLARALTGWTEARMSGANVGDWDARDFTKPMIKVPDRYDNTAKRFLGVTVPAGATQEKSVGRAIDAAFEHPSTAPWVSRYLIQNLVSANPSPDYVERVANVFVDNGDGVRGDMKAVIRAILTDEDARGSAGTGNSDGKLKEPVLVMTGIARAAGFVTDGFAFTQRDSSLGQSVFQAPSVFNFYPPDYPLPGSNKLLSPASKLLSSTGVIQVHNLVHQWTIDSEGSRYEFTFNPKLDGWKGTHVDWSAWQALGDDIDAMIDRVDLLLLARTMTSAQRSALRTVAKGITDQDAAVRARRRAQMLLYVVGSSPLSLVDR